MTSVSRINMTKNPLEKFVMLYSSIFLNSFFCLIFDGEIGSKKILIPIKLIFTSSLNSISAFSYSIPAKFYFPSNYSPSLNLFLKNLISQKNFKHAKKKFHPNHSQTLTVHLLYYTFRFQHVIANYVSKDLATATFKKRDIKKTNASPPLILTWFHLKS